MDYDYWFQDVTGDVNLQRKSSLYGLPKKMNSPDGEKNLGIFCFSMLGALVL